MTILYYLSHHQFLQQHFYSKSARNSTWHPREYTAARAFMKKYCIKCSFRWIMQVSSRYQLQVLCMETETITHGNEHFMQFFFKGWTKCSPHPPVYPLPCPRFALIIDSSQFKMVYLSYLQKFSLVLIFNFSASSRRAKKLRENKYLHYVRILYFFDIFFNNCFYY